MKFEEAYKTADDLFKSDGFKLIGVALAGETENLWLFKSHSVKREPLSPVSVCVEKKTGKLRYISVYDRSELKNAREIDIKDFNMQ